MDSIPRFIECSAHPEKIRYKHELLRPILDVTYGCIVYQEQVIEIFRRLAGFSLGQADMIPAFWMPNKTWPGCNVNDPSARVLSNYGASGQ